MLTDTDYGQSDYESEYEETSETYDPEIDDYVPKHRETKPKQNITKGKNEIGMGDMYIVDHPPVYTQDKRNKTSDNDIMLECAKDDEDYIFFYQMNKFNDIDIADIIYNNIKDDIIHDGDTIYKFSEKTHIWEIVIKNQKHNKLLLFIQQMVKKRRNSLVEKFPNNKQIRRLTDRVMNKKFQNYNIECRFPIRDPTIFQYKSHLMPFKNGVLDMGTGEFRDIERTDYINQTLDYDYQPDLDTTDAEKHINQMFFQIFNSDDSYAQQCVNNIAYWMLNINRQRLYSLAGPMASNGKSTILDLLEHVYPIFVYRANTNTFNKSNINSSDYNKTLLHFINKRVVILDEVNTDKIDGNALKSQTNESLELIQLYTAATMRLNVQHTLVFCGNDLLNVKSCEGLKRRLLVWIFKNRFLTPDEAQRNNTPIDNKKIFKKVWGMSDKFHEIEYKMALTKILIPHWKKIVKFNTIETPDVYIENMKETVDSGDYIGSFLKDYCKITGNPDDKQNKVRLFEKFKYCMDCTKYDIVTFNKKIKSEIKNKGYKIEYCKDKKERCKDKKHAASDKYTDLRGIYTGLKCKYEPIQ
jgi:phage/plasmid-associated DNA primase